MADITRDDLHYVGRASDGFPVNIQPVSDDELLSAVRPLLAERIGVDVDELRLLVIGFDYARSHGQETTRLDGLAFANVMRVLRALLAVLDGEVPS